MLSLWQRLCCWNAGLLIALWACTGQIDAAEFDLGHEFLVQFWGTDQGLPNNTLTSLAQTPDGYLWCGTYDGVVRFDGMRFVRIGPDDPIGRHANRVLRVHVDRKGQLWVGTDGAGIMRYSGGAFQAFAVAGDSSYNFVRAMVEDVRGDFWLGTRGGLGHLRVSDGALDWFSDPQVFTNAAGSIWNMVQYESGRLWMADWNSLKSFHEGQFQNALVRPAVTVPFRAVYLEPSGDCWAGMLGQILRREPRVDWVTIEPPHRPFNTEVMSFCKTRAGDLWVGTRRGLYCLRQNRWATFAADDELARSEVRDLFEDRDGNLWIGTGTRGLARLKKRLVRTYAAADGLTDERVFAVREKADGGLLVGLNDGRLLQSSGDRFVAVNNWTPSAPVKSLLQSRDGALWVGTFGNGLARLSGGAPSQLLPNVGTAARTDKVTALLQDRTGQVWVGTYYSLYKVSETNVLVPVPVDGRDLLAPVTALLERRAGGLWIACDGLGVAHFADGHAHWITRQDGLPTHFVRALHEDADGRLWIGTTAGLCCWRDEKLAVFTKLHGLVDEVISQILEDNDNNLWLGSNAGLMRIPKADLLAVADGRKSTVDIFSCDVGEGMLSAECSGGISPAGLKTGDGNLWFPTGKGLVMVDPSQLKSRMSSGPPPVYIEEVRADGRPPGNSHALELPAGSRRIEITYTAINFGAPERVRFKHRLEGYDSDWTEAGTARSVAYNKLPSGHYRFQVIACNNEGVWNEAGATLRFRIATPLWQSWWFLSLGALSAAGGLGAGIRVISVRHLRRKLRRLEQAHAIEKERMRIAQDMHDELGGKLSRISFLSDMARRNVPESTEANRQIEEVSDAAREVIKTVDEIVWAVSPRNDSLESLAHYICRYAEEFFELSSIDLELKLPDVFPVCRLPAEVRHNLFCAVKEALNNALKHAHATKVSIAFVLTDGSCEISVTDNGSGFDRAKGSDRAWLRVGNGMLNMQERLESIQGRFAVDTRPGHGTRVVFSVPLAQPSLA